MKGWKPAAAAAIIIACLFITLSYDIYSYHIWAYTAASKGVSAIYDKSAYFDRYLDYPPLGAFSAILTGKIISLVSPMRISSVPLLPLYKAVPALSLMLILLMFASARFKKREQMLSFLFAFPALFSVSCTGQTDTAVLIMLFAGIVLMEKKKSEAGVFMLASAALMKQTAVFFSFALILFQFMRSRDRAGFAFRAILVSSAVFLSAFLPFIIEGKLFETLRNIYSYTLENAGTLSVYAFNALSAVPGAQFIDINSKISFVSYKTISIASMVIFAAVSAFAFRKESIVKFAALFSLFWYNAAVGMKSQHIIYPLFFIVLFAADAKAGKRIPAAFCLLALLNMAASESALTMAIFGRPAMSSAFYIFFSVLQVMISAAAAVTIIRERHSSDFAPRVYMPAGLKTSSLIFILAAAVLLAAYLPSRVSVKRGDREFMSEIIRRGCLENYSRDKYIDLNIYSPAPFKNYLAVRMSSGSFFRINLPHDISAMSFRAKSGYGGKGTLNIEGDEYECSAVEKGILHRFRSGEVTFEAQSEGAYSQIVIYDMHALNGEGL